MCKNKVVNAGKTTLITRLLPVLTDYGLKVATVKHDGHEFEGEVPGGGVRAGESAEDAVKREILEETGVDVSNADGGYVFSYKRVNPEEKNNYFVDIFRYTMDIPDSAIHTQEREVMEYAFATLEQIQEYGKQGVFLHYDSIKQVFTD